MITKIHLLIISLFGITLFANEAHNAYSKATFFEQQGDIKNAMIWYKKAAQLSLTNETEEKKKETTLIKYGNNSIEGYQDEATNKTIKQIIFSAFDIESYRSNYLLPVTYDKVEHLKRENTETKFQISFKKALSYNLFGLNEKIFLAYTQTSWWQTTAPSAPFRETNYEPELFVTIPFDGSFSPLKTYTLGLTHQSNGRFFGSRSWNRAYISGIFQYKGVFIEPRAWYRFKEDEKSDPSDTSGDDNPDIEDYLGYGDLKLAYPYKEHLFSLLLRNNLKFNGNNKGAVQFDWTFPIPWISDLYGYLQIFSGYGESLIDYDKRVEKIGLGFAITR